MEHMGLVSLIPTSVVILLAIFSKRALEPLIGGVIIGFLILEGSGVMGATIDSALTVLGDDVIRWIILAVGLFGALSSLLVHAGGASAFSNYLMKYIKSRKSALISTWLLGLIIFIDDYLNALTVGSSMKGLTDKFKISRQMLAYVVDTTAAPICVLIPLSTWAIYVSGLLEENGVAGAGEGILVYIQSIPYMIYPIVAAILVPLVALKIIPSMGPMKKAEMRAAAGEDTATLVGHMEIQPDVKSRQRIVNFLIPVLSLLFFTWFFDVDILKGVICALITTFILYGIQQLLPYKKMFDYSMDGLKGMVPAISIIVVSFMLKEVNDRMGLTFFVIDSVEPYMSATMLPVITFAALALIAFATGSFWGMYAIALPIVLPLGAAIGVDTPILIGTVVSAGAFGSHACFYGDSTVLSATATDIDPVDHALTQLPYILLSGSIAIVILVLIGMA